MQRCRPDDLGRESLSRKVVSILEENQISTIVIKFVHSWLKANR